MIPMAAPEELVIFCTRSATNFAAAVEIQLQGLNQFLGFYDRGKIFGEVGMDFLSAQTIIVLLEHIRSGEKLLKRGLIKKRLTLRAGSSLCH